MQRSQLIEIKKNIQNNKFITGDSYNKHFKIKRTFGVPLLHDKLTHHLLFCFFKAVLMGILTIY